MKSFVKFTTSHHVYYECGSVYSGGIEAPTRKELLKKMKEFCSELSSAEVVTFEPIKKVVTTSEVKGKFTIFKRITNRYTPKRKILEKYYKEV